MYLGDLIGHGSHRRIGLLMVYGSHDVYGVLTDLDSRG